MRLKKEPSKTTTKTKVTGSKGPKRKTRRSSKPKSREEVLAKVLSEVDVSSIAPDDRYKFICLDTPEKLLGAFEAFLEDDPNTLAVDTETEGLKWKHRIIGVSFSWDNDHNYYIPMRHIGDEKQLFVEECVDVLNEMFSHKEKNYVFHNYKYDFHKLAKEGIRVKGKVHDTMLMHYILDENDRHGLKHLASKFIDQSEKGFLLKKLAILLSFLISSVVIFTLMKLGLRFMSGN